MKYLNSLIGLLLILNTSCSSDDSSPEEDTDTNPTSETIIDEEENLDPLIISDEEEDDDITPPSSSELDNVVQEIDDTKPYGKIIWKNWVLSVPIDKGGGEGKATSIFYQDIVTNTFTSAEAKYIKENEDGSFNLFSEFTGYTTSGESGLNQGKFCRTELREFWRGEQTTDDNWFMDEGLHMMESTLKVVSCEGDQDCIIAQIHGKKSSTAQGSPATIKIRWIEGEIIVDYYRALPNSVPSTRWTSANDDKITIGDVANEQFTVQLKVENGVFSFGLICEAKGIDTGYTEIYDYKSNGYTYDNYFKTGNYFIWDGNKTDSSEIILYNVFTEHN